QGIDQTEALRELRSNHDDLRREFLASRRRAEDLDRHLAGAANAASPYVLFCQHKYDVIRHKLESTRTELAECLNALHERLDNSRELEACRLRGYGVPARAVSIRFTSRARSPVCPRFGALRISYVPQDGSEDRVSAARDTIARLEKRITQVEKSQKSRQDLELALSTLRQERDSRVVQRDELLGQLGERFMEVTDLRAERDQAQERLSSIASFLPSAPSHKRARSESESPAQSARISKAA
ncbi:hypothetical protein L914_21674, partial [Phytophthora nicotianae]